VGGDGDGVLRLEFVDFITSFFGSSSFMIFARKSSEKDA
jgi:hypothetical protein